MKTPRLGILALILVIISLGMFGTTHAHFTAKQVTGPHILSTWQSFVWIQTTQSDFEKGVVVNVNTTTSPGSVVLGNQTSEASLHASMGGSRNFLRYFISNNTWEVRAVTPSNVGTGGGVRYVGAGNIFALRGGNTNAFWLFNISTNTWSVKTVTPGNVNTGGTLLDYCGSGNISALRGAGTTAFWIYNISSNSWSVKAPSPAAVGAGGVLAYIGSGNIAALRGASTPAFWIYNISSDSWSVKANAPGNVGAGAAVAFDNGKFLYALNGRNTRNFWRYNISANTWTSLANIPGNVGAGGSLVSDTGNYIYAFNGTRTPHFWRYDILSNSWSNDAVSSPPFNVVAGGSLTYTESFSAYSPVGTLASPVYDTDTAGMVWDSLMWEDSLVTGTNITFDVRASDTLYAKTDILPLWQQSGWPSPVDSGLPSGRYIQWRATLSTSNSSRTPVLHEVRVSYS